MVDPLQQTQLSRQLLALRRASRVLAQREEDLRLLALLKQEGHHRLDGVDRKAAPDRPVVRGAVPLSARSTNEHGTSKGQDQLVEDDGVGVRDLDDRTPVPAEASLAVDVSGEIRKPSLVVNASRTMLVRSATARRADT